ncbi:response regulator transcription factor [Streptomyces sp. NPDC097619]|uniref:response regulator transcription factor n=1 Tax=Streptomyces sp. NPDC097619 TaxID=3157228 RepID=UPI00331F96CC
MEPAPPSPAPEAPGRPGAAPLRVLIADDQAMVRLGFRLILDAQPDLEVVGEAADGAACVEMARRLRPDVCVVDVRMPALDGLDVTRALAGPGVPDPLKVVIVTTFDHDAYLYGALRAGAVGFVLKNAGPDLLLEAVRAAARGDALVSPAVTLRLLEHLAEQPGGPLAGRPGTPSAERSVLSERELEVVRMVARGRTNQEIADGLWISLSTVKTHLTAIQTKLRLRNRVEIAAWAWETGQISPR